MAHDGAVLAHALVHPHRPQPPPERHGVHRRGRDRLPGLERPPARARRHHRPGAARQRLEHLLGRQGPQRPTRGGQPGRPEVQLAAAAGLRPLLRLPRRRDQPVVSDAGRGQPRDRAAVPARGGLPPLQGPRRPGDADAARQHSPRPSRPWFMWLCPGANHAPHHVDPEWADRYKGQFDDGYEAYREWVLERMVEKGIMPAGHRAHAAQPDARGHVQPQRHGAAVGLAVGRREAAVRADGRGLRRLLRVHRPPGRPGHRLPRGERASSTTR